MKSFTSLFLVASALLATNVSAASWSKGGVPPKGFVSTPRPAAPHHIISRPTGSRPRGGEKTAVNSQSRGGAHVEKFSRMPLCSHWRYSITESWWSGACTVGRGCGGRWMGR